MSGNQSKWKNAKAATVITELKKEIIDLKEKVEFWRQKFCSTNGKYDAAEANRLRKQVSDLKKERTGLLTRLKLYERPDSTDPEKS